MYEDVCFRREAQKAQREQRVTIPGNAGTRMWEDLVLVVRIAQQVRATMAAENGAAREDEPSASMASSSTAGDGVAPGTEEKAERPKTPKIGTEGRSQSSKLSKDNGGKEHSLQVLMPPTC
uniref:Uncharacterized protein n=1 Tax=Romanomermis culicivorax TaxID=13658 RepID=A0A915HDB0_ROMCU